MSLLISGEIKTLHNSPECVADALSADNLLSMKTVPDGVYVRTVIKGNKLRSVVASVDDYLMNLSVAEEICGMHISHAGEQQKIIKKVN